MSLSAPVTVQVREYIDPAIGVATPAVTRDSDVLDLEMKKLKKRNYYISIITHI